MLQHNGNIALVRMLTSHVGVNIVHIRGVNIVLRAVDIELVSMFTLTLCYRSVDIIKCFMLYVILLL